MDWKKNCSPLTLAMKSSMIRELVEMTKSVPGLISFAGGFPSPATFPTGQLAELFHETVGKEGESILQYGSTGGEDKLKEAVINEDNLNIDKDEIQICSGATNGIYNAVRTFLSPGDLVISESPSFLGSLVTFEAVGAKVLPVAMQADGMDVDQLQEQINKHGKEKIKFIYTIPDFQNPTGISMSSEKRKKLIEVAVNNDIIIIEDDPYSKLRFTGQAGQSLLQIARQIFDEPDVVISVRSFSKLLGPGLRIAYAVGGKEIISYMNSWSQKINVTTDRISQRVVAAYLQKGWLPDHIEHIRNIYRPLCDCMVCSLERYMPETVRWVKPEGGMFLWLQLPKGYNADNLFHKALKEKVAFIPGSKFYPDGVEEYNGLRLNFSYPSEEQIEEGIRRLAKVIG